MTEPTVPEAPLSAGDVLAAVPETPTAVPTNSGPSKKPPVLDGKVWVGFDLGGTKMSAVLFDRKFDAIAVIAQCWILRALKPKRDRGAQEEAQGTALTCPWSPCEENVRRIRSS